MKMTFVGIVAALLVVTPSLAQSTNSAEPSDPKAAVPLVQYRSAFEQYRPMRDEKAVGWKSANDTVGQIGGWKAYAREAQAAPAIPAGPNLPATSGSKNSP